MIARLFVMALAMMTTGITCARSYPDRHIRVIPGHPGGDAYMHMLLLRDALINRLGQALVMDARPANLLGGHSDAIAT